MPNAVDTNVENSLIILKAIHNRLAGLIETPDFNQSEKKGLEEIDKVEISDWK